MTQPLAPQPAAGHPSEPATEPQPVAPADASPGTTLETHSETGTEPDGYHERFAASRWWRDARFGMFIHWGAYAVPARGEWVRSTERITLDAYEEAIDAFVPADVNFEEWAELAWQAGMRYAVMTAKHHDGYCLFDSALTDYSTVKRGPRRDLVKGFLDAFRARGLKVGLYFSVIDWAREDFPHFDDLHHPMRANPAYADHQPDLASYREYLHGQVRELCTNYGQLDVMWFDFSYGEMSGPAWDAEALLAMVRDLQPGIIVDNRLETSGAGLGSLTTGHPLPWAGDFVSPEQIVPARGIVADDGRPVPWESCVTLNNHWGYHATDEEWKPAASVIRKLVECTAKGGNLLLNVGPDAQGVIPQGSQVVLREVGEWLARHEESIRGAGPAGIPKPEWGWYTRRGSTIYAHVFDQPFGPLPLTGIDRDRISGVRSVTTGDELGLSDAWVTQAYPDLAFVGLGEPQEFTHPLADVRDTVLAIEVRD